MKLYIYIESGISNERKKKNKYTNEYWFVYQYMTSPGLGFEEADFEIVGVGGKDKLRMYDNDMKQHTAAGDINLVIFDCDNESIDGGISNRRQQMETMKAELGITFDCFFFPNNHDDGAFEDLLLQIINPDHRGLIDCFTQYERCVGGQDPNGEKYVCPNTKAKIYAYISTFCRTNEEEKEMKNGNWKFENRQYWDLSHPFLQPLYDFLTSHRPIQDEEHR